MTDVDAVLNAQKPCRVMLHKLPKNLDSFGVRKEAGIAKTASIQIYYEQTTEADPQSLANFVEDMRSIIPDQEKVKGITSFMVGLRAGFNVCYETFDHALAAAGKIDGDATRKERHGQPVRLESVFTMSTRVRKDIFHHIRSDFDRMVDKFAKPAGATVKWIDVNNQTNAIQITFRFPDLSLQKLLQEQLENLFVATIFAHPKKALLFTAAGRIAMDALMQKRRCVRVDRYNKAVQIFLPKGSPLAVESENEIKAIITRLDGGRDEVFMLKPNQANEAASSRLKGEIIRMSGVMGVYLVKRKMTVTATEDALERVKRMLVGQKAIFTARQGVEDSCIICFETLNDNNSLSMTLCSHRHHMSEDCTAIDTMPPVKCFSSDGCQEEMCIADIVSLFPQDWLDSFKTAAANVFAHSHHIRSCPGNCNQLVPPATAGFDCDQCLKSFCIPCSEFAAKPIETHAGMTCVALRSQLAPEAQGLLRQIQDDILTNKCPRCKAAWIDFSGCLAVSCGCGCGFCGLCSKDCASDAHPHVMSECRLRDPG